MAPTRRCARSWTAFLARQLIVEILLIAGVGAVAGLIVAQWTSRLLVRQLSTTMGTVFLDLRLDWRTLAFTIAIALGTALLAGVAPSLRASRADPIGRVVRMVLGRVLLLIGIGVTAGVVVTMWVSRYVETLLYGVTREDPTTLVVAACVLVVVGGAAGWIPARRASRIDPARVLHGE